MSDNDFCRCGGDTRVRHVDPTTRAPYCENCGLWCAPIDALMARPNWGLRVAPRTGLYHDADLLGNVA